MKRLLLGPHAVIEALRAAGDRVSVVYSEELTAGAGSALDGVLRLARDRKVRCEARTRAELDTLARGTRHQGVLAIAGEYPYVNLASLLEDRPPHVLLVALDQVTDPHNLGAIVRSAVALGAHGLITLKDRAAPVTGAVVRASAGATELARIARVTNLARTLDELRGEGLQVIGLAPDGAAELAELPYPDGGRVLVIGSEGAGLRRLVRERCDALARIELAGPVQSLNASVAAGIAVYESVRQRQLVLRSVGPDEQAT
jgi:23S rRNA (guanosine2251-2'-O)-methyltransferase